MKRVILALVVLFPITLAAQEGNPSPVNNQSVSDPTVQAKLSTAGDEVASALMDSSADLAYDPDPNAAQQPHAQPSQPKRSPRETKPKIPGSMVGYIDDPIVATQIRIRFDAAFEDQFPDRSEFFYAKCSCFRTIPGPAVDIDPNAPGPGPGVPTAINFQQLFMNVEYSPQRRFSAFVEVPIRWLQPQGFIPGSGSFSNQAGLSDVTAGLKFAAVASEGTYVTFQFKSYFPSGDASKGLGTNHYSVEPSLLMYHSFSERWTLEGQIGDWHPIGGSAGVPTIGASEGFAGDVFFYGLGPSYKLYQGNHIGLVPVIELFGWHVLSGFQTQPIPGVSWASEVNGMNIVNLKFGVRTNINFHNSFYVGFGQALTHDDWYKHIVRLEYRYSF